MKRFITFACIAATSASALAATSKSDLDSRLNDAKQVITEIMMTPDNSVPLSIAQSATCVGVIPSVKKGAFIVGASYGQGVVTCRTPNGWSAPVFIRLGGGSVGFQIGGQATDLVLVAVNDKGFQDMMQSKLKLGANASAAAGPVGRNAGAGTDWKLNAELLTYSRAKGLFAGIDLNGDSITQNEDDTKTFYGGNTTTPADILKGKLPVPPDAAPFVRTVSKYFIKAKTQ